MTKRFGQLRMGKTAANHHDDIILSCISLLGHNFWGFDDLTNRLEQEAPGGRSYHALYAHNIIAARIEQRRKPDGERRPIDAVIQIKPRR